MSRYPPALGVAGPLFFVTHGHPEAFDPETRSRSNEHEAAFCAGLAAHLLRSGYAAGQITVPPGPLKNPPKPKQTLEETRARKSARTPRLQVLTTYCGQLFSLRKRFRAPGGERGMDEVRLCSVDQYQASESQPRRSRRPRAAPRASPPAPPPHRPPLTGRSAPPFFPEAG